jgi:hypothetical protein
MPPDTGRPSLDGPRADAGPRPVGRSIRTQLPAEIQQHVLRVGCRRCGRTVEIQNADAVRLAGTQGGLEQPATA